MKELATVRLNVSSLQTITHSRISVLLGMFSCHSKLVEALLLSLQNLTMVVWMQIDLAGYIGFSVRVCSKGIHV